MISKDNFKDLFLADYYFVVTTIKNNNFFYFLCLLIITPFSFFFFTLFIFFTLYYCIIYNLIFFFKKFLCFFKGGEIRPLIFKLNTKRYNNNFILVILIFLNTAKKKAYKIMYNFQKIYHEKNKNKLNFSLLFYLIFFFFLRLIFIFFFYFNIKVFEISIKLLNLLIRYKKKNLSFKQYLELVFINFIQIYDSNLSDFIKNHKIIFDSKKIIIFNPGNQIKILKSLLNDKFKLNNENLNLIFQCINILKENSDLEYNILVEEVEKNYPDSFIMSNGKYYIGEKIPHTSLILPISEKEAFLIRETKSNIVETKELNEGSIVSSDMKTGFKGFGSINKELTVYKTPTINSNLENIYHQNNNKLLNNLLSNLTNKNDFVGQFLSSIYKPVYIFEKGSIYKDPKYLNFHDKLINNVNYQHNKTDSMQVLKNLVDIWDKHFYIFKEIPNSEVVENVVKFCITQSDFIIPPEILQEIFDL